MTFLSKCQSALITLLSIACVSCSDYSQTPLQGYIEGEYIYITSNFPGTLIYMYVQRGQTVKQGDLLLQLEPEPESYGVTEAKAALAQNQAELYFNKLQLERQTLLYPRKATEKSTLDLAQKEYDSKQEQLLAATAKLNQAKWDLHQKTFKTPIDSVVIDIYYRLGERVGNNQPILSLLAPRYVHVLFYVPEPLLSRIHLGQIISFTCDSCKSKTQAVIHYISPIAEYTPPIIYSKDTRNKLVYLIRADMPEETTKQFHPGQPLDVFLHE